MAENTHERIYEMSLNVLVAWQAHSLSTIGSNGSNRLLPRRQLLADKTETDACSGNIAKHHHADEGVDPDRCERAVSAADEAMIRAVLAAHLPAADGRRLAATTCLYTLTPDGDFILDRLPGHEAIIVASPCSGHGFKFAPLIGEILADLAMAGTTSHDISRFSLARFA